MKLIHQSEFIFLLSLMMEILGAGAIAARVTGGVIGNLERRSRWLCFLMGDRPYCCLRNQASRSAIVLKSSKASPNDSN
jgi:hypothetical protein